MNDVSNAEGQYDYIVVGAGAAGSVLAAELSASSLRTTLAVLSISGLFSISAPSHRANRGRRRGIRRHEKLERQFRQHHIYRRPEHRSHTEK